MSNKNIHEAMILEERIECPFCNEKLVEIKSTPTQCCGNPERINNKHIVCTNCGSVHGQLPAREFIDFYDNKYKFYKKIIRKYHLLITTDIIKTKYKTDIPIEIRAKILQIIVPVMTQLNQNPKRMICTKYIIRNLLKFMKIDYQNLFTTWARFPLFSPWIKFNIPRSLSII